MEESRRKLIAGILLGALLAVEAFFYVLVLAGRATSVLLYLSIVTAAAAALVLLCSEKNRESRFLFPAMVYTLGADALLVLLDDRYEEAVAIFFVAQCFHAIRLLTAEGAGGKKRWKGSVAIRLALSAAALIVLAVIGQFSRLTALGALYAAELFMNLVDAVISGIEVPRLLLAALGFLLFIACDVTVGLNGMKEAWNVPDGVADALGRLTWVFYLPSQVLIVWSAFTLPHRRKE